MGILQATPLLARNDIKNEQKKFYKIRWDTKRALSVISLILNDQQFSDEFSEQFSENNFSLKHSDIFVILNSLFIDEKVESFKIETYKSSSVEFSNEQIIYYLMM